MAVDLPACFKAYDIRGKVPSQLDAAMAGQIGRCFGAVFDPGVVVVGHDIRLSSPELIEALAAGLNLVGVNVLHLGLCGTEEVYHAAFSMADQGVGGGIMITASHNPAEYNGMKFVQRCARPVSGNNGLFAIGEMITAGKVPEASRKRGSQTAVQDKTAYIEHLLTHVDVDRLTPMRVVANSGNGCAGAVIDLLEPLLPIDFIRLHHQPDGSFPNGVPNPLLSKNREETAAAVIRHGADFGIGWDGDFDRCFFWDENGRFIDGYYMVGLLAQEMLLREQGAKILHDPRLVWNTRELVAEAGGVAIQTSTGHALIKEKMWKEAAVYGGEMSAHHYFRDFGCCDSGMIPWLLICSLMSRTSQTLSSLVDRRMEAYPISGEINSEVDDPDAVIAAVEQAFSGGDVDRMDGLSVAFDDFRFNIRKSNTEPLLRLNVETRGNPVLLKEKTDELLALIRQ
jgi:phosphomannomutase